MRLPLRTGALASVLATAIASGCAGPSNVSPWQNPRVVFGSSASPGAIADAPLSRLIAGTWRSSPSACSGSASTLGGADSGSNAGTLFVSDYGPSKIEEFDASGANQTPLGALSTGLKNPWGISVDKNGTLYVANWNLNQALEFPQGATSPSVTLTQDILAPLDVAADPQGNVYVVNGRGGPIVIFPPGQSSSPTILGGFDYPTGVAFDSNGNLYVVDELYGTKKPLGAVFKFAPGSQTGVNLHLTKLNYPVGIALNSSDDLAITNLGNNTVTQFAQGATIPKRTIATGICDPTYPAFNASNVLYIANNGGPPNGNVTGYKPTTKRPFVTLTHNMANVRGVAVNPNWQPSSK